MYETGYPKLLNLEILCKLAAFYLYCRFAKAMVTPAPVI